MCSFGKQNRIKGIVSLCSLDNSVMVCFGNVDWWSLVYSVFVYRVKVRHCSLKCSLKIRPKSFKIVPKYLRVSIVLFLLLIPKMRWLVSHIPCKFSISTDLYQCGSSGAMRIVETWSMAHAFLELRILRNSHPLGSAW